MDLHVQPRTPSAPLLSNCKAVAATRKMVEEDDNDWAAEEEEEEEEEESGGDELPGGSRLKKKRMNLAGGSGIRSVSSTGASGAGGGRAEPPPPGCQAEKCNADLTHSKRYHKRHKVCEYHAKAQAVMVAGRRQRFCQQCSRFHELSEFDEAKRSCRRRLAGHNQRRRKHVSDSHGEGRISEPQIKKNQRRQVDQKGRTAVFFPESCQNFHIH